MTFLLIAAVAGIGSLSTGGGNGIQNEIAASGEKGNGIYDSKGAEGFMKGDESHGIAIPSDRGGNGLAFLGRERNGIVSGEKDGFFGKEKDGFFGRDGNGFFGRDSNGFLGKERNGISKGGHG
eukprot:Plantae.Rhodophyta-Purpureofilum_apyrenoidigerum.ctg19013.p2 GENE.Plantae.Rhodophyta-Purpureofilum_apyrenoidigerum.ctg19013~~Plantae.Rhodophyta-Purpureofilum_apyrenoidigerum.ctg19013.p2  ORF type:complete len:123 (-),score=29.35 Plantae.Rhodophyta-Purpureofilum_apyrenoidigerum.ctg19013:782-1150(-)